MMEFFSTFYRCCRCGEVFRDDEADIRDDGTYEEYWGRDVWMPAVVPVCPWCGSDDLEETDDPEDAEEDN